MQPTACEHLVRKMKVRREMNRVALTRSADSVPEPRCCQNYILVTVLGVVVVGSVVAILVVTWKSTTESQRKIIEIERFKTVNVPLKTGSDVAFLPSGREVESGAGLHQRLVTYKCKERPCGANAICVERPDGFVCLCKPGFNQTTDGCRAAGDLPDGDDEKWRENDEEDAEDDDDDDDGAPQPSHPKFEVKFTDDIWCSEVETPDIPLQFFQSNPTKRPVIIADNNPEIGRETYYAILMVDPDAPRHDDPNMADWFHWGLYNIPGDLLIDDVLDVTELTHHGYRLFNVIANYKPPTPPKRTGPHRYHIILLEQMDGVSGGIPRIIRRNNFNLNQFLAQHHMKEIIRATFRTENTA